jgi:hypothetical protein
VIGFDRLTVRYGKTTALAGAPFLLLVLRSRRARQAES